MCRDKNNDKNKRNLPPPPQTFSLFLLTFCEKLNIIAYSGLFCINFMDFNLLQTKMKENIPLINVKTKVF